MIKNRVGIYLSALMFLLSALAWSQTSDLWQIHDMDRPRPQIITPGTASTQERPGQAPSDAIVLFEGKDLSHWRAMDGGPAKWVVKNNVIETVKGAGYIRSYREFGSCQLHIEFSTPFPALGSSQGRGNSGVFLMGRYEVQVLDSYENITYADGQASAVYAQYPPLVNASRPPGQWQTFDIVFRRPVFDQEGKVQRPAIMTVFHNGILVQDHVELTGPTGWLSQSPYSAHAEKLSISLQDHGNPVRYRNIWVRELVDPADKLIDKPSFKLADDLLKKYTGRYGDSGRGVEIQVRDGHLEANVYGVRTLMFYAESETRFYAREVDITLDFQLDAENNVSGLVVSVASSPTELKKID